MREIPRHIEYHGAGEGQAFSVAVTHKDEKWQVCVTWETGGCKGEFDTEDEALAFVTGFSYGLGALQQKG